MTSLDVPSPGLTNSISSKFFITASSVKNIDYLPIIVRVLKKDGSIDKNFNATVNIDAGSATINNNQIRIRNGVGAVISEVNASNDFEISIPGFSDKKLIKLNNFTSGTNKSGTLEMNEIWYGGSDYYITNDLIVPQDLTLTIEAGARLLISSGVKIDVKGNLKVNGIYANPVIFMAEDRQSKWSGLVLENHQSDFDLNYAIFVDAGSMRNNFGQSMSQPVIMSNYSKVNIDNCFIFDNVGKAIGAQRSIINISNSLFLRCDTGGEFKFCKTDITNTWLLELPDNDFSNIDVDNDGLNFFGTPYQENEDYPFIYNRSVFHQVDEETPSIVDNCVFYANEDNAVDMYKANVLIKNSIFNTIRNEAILAGYWTDVQIEKNLISNSGIGFSTSYYTSAFLDHNTFYQNNIAIKALSFGGAIVNNTILSSSISSDISYDGEQNNTVYFKYCLSDKISLPGKNNIYKNPEFVDPSSLNFMLSQGSPAINSGDPASYPDPDGSRADIGLFPYSLNSNSNIVINEIHYNPAPEQGADEDFEFIEIFNPSGFEVDISGYSLDDGIQFVFPSGTSIKPGEFIVVARNKWTYSDIPCLVFEWKNGALSNQGEKIILLNRTGLVIDEVSYLDNSPWPQEADGDGYSLELINPVADNSTAYNWRVSHLFGGTPGDYSVRYDYSVLKINEFIADNKTGLTNEFGEHIDWIEIYNSGNKSINIGGVYISNDFSNPLLWRIPFGEPGITTIEPGGFLTLYADEQITNSVLHVDFKLGRNGDQIVLSHVINQTAIIIDSYQYGAQQTDVSTGRAGDGEPSWISFNSPTPGKSNFSSSNNIISMRKMKSGERIPVIFKYNTEEGELDLNLYSEKSLLSETAAINNDKFGVYNGIGSITSTIISNQDFYIGAEDMDDTHKVEIEEIIPTIFVGDITYETNHWISDFDYNIVAEEYLTIQDNESLIIDAGTRVFINNEVTINCFGKLQINGTIDNPVLFISNNSNETWGGLKILNSTDSVIIKYCFFVNGGGNSREDFGHTNVQPVFYAENSNVRLDNCFFIDNLGKAVAGNGSSIIINNSVIARSDGGGEFHDSDVNIFRTWLNEIPSAELKQVSNEHDAVYLLNNNSANINQVYISNISDDGIDILSSNETNIINSVVSSSMDKAVSVEHSDVNIDYVLFRNNDVGVASKTNTHVYIDHNTFYNNKIGISSYSRNSLSGDGHSYVSNSIISFSQLAPFSKEAGSTIDFEYSLCDGTDLPGENNINSDPLFVNPESGNFLLRPGSLAINSGNPNFPDDLDNTRSDMGAFYFDHLSAEFIVINEIHYHPSVLQGDEMDYEFIELVNTAEIPIDISAYRLSKGLSYEFSPGTIVKPGEYIVIARNEAIYSGNDYKVFQSLSGELSNDGGTIELTNSLGEIINIVNYSNGSGWPTSPDGGGSSIELTYPSLNNKNPENWRASFDYGGTPGKPNVNSIIKDLYINEFMPADIQVMGEPPNEDWIELYNAGTKPVNVGGLYFTDDLNNPLRYHIPNTQPAATTIEPRGFLLFWADNLVDNGILHIGMRLRGGGEQIGLSQQINGETVFIDALTYEAQADGLSKGRISDGNPEWILFEIPTPGGPNSDISPVFDISTRKTDNIMSVYPNPFTEIITVKFNIDKASKVYIPVIDQTGKIVQTLSSGQIDLPPGTHKMKWNGKDNNGNQLPQGVYFIRLITNEFSYVKKSVLMNR